MCNMLLRSQLSFSLISGVDSRLQLLSMPEQGMCPLGNFTVYLTQCFYTFRINTCRVQGKA